MVPKIRQSCKKIKYRLQNLQNCKIEGGWILKYGLRLFLLWNIIEIELQTTRADYEISFYV